MAMQTIATKTKRFDEICSRDAKRSLYYKIGRTISKIQFNVYYEERAIVR